MKNIISNQVYQNSSQLNITIISNSFDNIHNKSINNDENSNVNNIGDNKSNNKIKSLLDAMNAAAAKSGRITDDSKNFETPKQVSEIQIVIVPC